VAAVAVRVKKVSSPVGSSRGSLFTPDQVKVGFPHGGPQYLVQPRGNGSAPDGNCAGCFYVQASDPDGTSPYVNRLFMS
jgi:hypothetical protein